MSEITENVQNHIATYADARAVAYVINDSNGKKLASIVIDLVSFKDYGLNQATSNLLTALLNAHKDVAVGYTIRKYLIG